MKLANSRLVLFATLFLTRFLGRFSARLAAMPAYLLWFTPWRIPVSDRGLRKQARWLETAQPFTVRTTGGRIGGFVAGEGPSVLLVHGWGERAASLGGFIAPLREAGFRVIGVDLPAHGASGGQTSNPIEAAVALIEVADHFGGAHAVIAHSLGGTTALRALGTGLAVNRAVLIAPNVDPASARRTFQTMFGLPDRAMDGLKRRIERRFGPDVWHQIDGVKLAANLHAPGLVFHDPDDPQVPFVGSEELVRAWTGATLVGTPGLGHGAITRDPSVIASAVAFAAGAREGLVPREA